MSKVIYKQAHTKQLFNKASKYLQDKGYIWVGLDKNPTFEALKRCFHGNSKMYLKGFYNDINNKFEIQATTNSIEKTYPQHKGGIKNMKFKEKYNTIEKIDFDDGVTSYFLTGNDIDDTLECDLGDGLFFNEFPENKIKRTFVKKVSSLTEVKKFMDEHNLNYKEFCINDGTLKIGGSHDMNLYEDLTFEWED